MRRAPQPIRTLQRRLRVHVGERRNCPCVRCEAADEIDRLQAELWEAYEQVTLLIGGSYHTPAENNVEAWAEIADDLPDSIRNSHPSTD